MSLPRGYSIVGERIEDGRLVLDVRIARWRMALIALGVLRRIHRRVTVIR